MKNKHLFSFFLLFTYAMVLAQCPASIQITDNVFSPNVIEKQASGTITATNTINNGAGAVYRSQTGIILKNGFRAVNGSKFQAYIANCTSYTCPLPKNLTAVVNPDYSTSLSWTVDASTTVTAWRIQVIPAVAGNLAIDEVYNSGSPYTYVIPPGELSSGANYTFMINPVCDANSGGNYVKSISFTAPEYTELIWNNKTKYRNWQHNNEYEGVIPQYNTDPEYYSYCSINNFTDAIPNRPPAPGETLKCYLGNGNSSVNTVDYTGSIIFDTVNYKDSEYITGSPTNAAGFKYDINYSSGQPIEFNLYNQMYNGTQPPGFVSTLREVCLMFWHWQGVSAADMTDNSGKYSFRRSFDLNEFDDNIIVSFKAKINKSIVKTTVSGSNSFLTSDLRFQYYNGNQVVFSGLVGVIFYENNLYGPDNLVYWTDYKYDNNDKYSKMLIRGSKQDIKVCDFNYQEITINYKNFISQLALPDGLVYDKVIITGLDIYTHIEANADLNFSVKDVKILGIPSANSNGKFAGTDGRQEELSTVSLNESRFFSIAPNPANNIITITGTEAIKSILITSLDGKTLYSNTLHDKTNSLDVVIDGYSKGMYNVTVIMANGEVETQKLVKN